MARVLVADDAPDVRTLIETILAGDGHDVVTAADGLEALQRFLDDSFDLVCTDFEMPRLNGVELTRAVRANRAGVPILMAGALTVGCSGGSGGTGPKGTGGRTGGTGGAVGGGSGGSGTGGSAPHRA